MMMYLPNFYFLFLSWRDDVIESGQCAISSGPAHVNLITLAATMDPSIQKLGLF